MPKRGLLFEQVVADILKSFDEVSDVVQGKWIAGPYGRRDRDVSFSGNISGKAFKGLIECKDYNPCTTGRVGIELIDALDSKRRELGIDFAFVCSNAGFAKPALKKAAAVNIALIGALRKGDHRLKFDVKDTLYTRKLSIPVQGVHIRLFTADGAQAAPGATIDAWTFQGLKFRNWLIQYMHWILKNPITNGYLLSSVTFTQPVALQLDNETFQIVKMDIRFELRGAWYRHRVTFDASNGFYNWARKRSYVGVKGNRFIQVRDLDIHGGHRVETPPQYVLNPLPFVPGEGAQDFVLINGAMIDGPVPNLYPYLTEEDRYGRMPPSALSDPAVYTSTPGYQHPAD